MIKRVIVLSRNEAAKIKQEVLTNKFDKFGKFDNVLCVSIQCLNDPFLFTNQDMKTHDPLHRRIISFQFDDINPDTMYMGCSFAGTFYMKQEQAVNIVKFIHRWTYNTTTNDLLIAHCAAGISRSGAIGEFAATIADVDKEVFHNDNKHIQPNKWVLYKLFETFDRVYPKTREEFYHKHYC